jgi:hypothetical protein
MNDVKADEPVRLSWGSVVLYVLLIGAAIAGFFAVRHLGRDVRLRGQVRRQLRGGPPLGPGLA